MSFTRSSLKSYRETRQSSTSGFSVFRSSVAQLFTLIRCLGLLPLLIHQRHCRFVGSCFNGYMWLITFHPLFFSSSFSGSHHRTTATASASGTLMKYAVVLISSRKSGKMLVQIFSLRGFRFLSYTKIFFIPYVFKINNVFLGKVKEFLKI